MSNKMPMVFSMRSTRVIQPEPQPTPQPTPPQTSQSMPRQNSSRFSMHDLYKVAKKGCKSCGG